MNDFQSIHKKAIKYVAILQINTPIATYFILLFSNDYKHLYKILIYKIMMEFKNSFE